MVANTRLGELLGRATRLFGGGRIAHDAGVVLEQGARSDGDDEDLEEQTKLHE